MGWETFFCDCPLGYGGKDCSHGERLFEFIFYPVVVCVGFIANSNLYLSITNETMVEIIGSFSLVPVMMRVVIF